jgi:hypothetical protein
MRNVTVALGSFIVGAMSMSLLGNHTSTLAQAPERTHGHAWFSEFGCAL